MATNPYDIDVVPAVRAIDVLINRLLQFSGQRANMTGRALLSGSVSKDFEGIIQPSRNPLLENCCSLLMITSSDAYDTFTCFPKLPLELRRMIVSDDKLSIFL